MPELNKALFAEAYSNHEKALYNMVYRWVWNEHTAMDIVHDAFVRLWHKRDQIREDTFIALLYKTTLNLCHNHYRYQKLRQWLPTIQLDNLKDGHKSHIDKLISDEEKQTLAKIMQKLPMRLRDVLMLSEFSDLEYGEIATILNIPKGTVGSRRNKAIKLLQQHYDKLNNTWK